MFDYRHRSYCPRVEQLERRELLSVGAMGPPQSPGQRGRPIAGDDYGNTLAQAALVSLSTAGAGSQSGTIERAGDVDMFKIVAPVSGQMTITQSAIVGSRLDACVYVYDANGHLLAQNDDYGGSQNSQVTIDVTAGTTYFVKAAAHGRTAGAYAVQFTTSAAVADDFPDTIAAAATVELSTNGGATQSGTIEQAGDVDMFKIVAPVSGQMTVTQSATVGSRLDAHVYIYDANGQLLAQNDDYGGTRNSQVTIDVTAGTTYYVEAAAYGRTAGDYTLAISTAASTTTPTEPTEPTEPTDPTTGGFQIDVTMSGFTSAQREIVQQAVDRWEAIIVGDLPDVTYQGQTIDDLSITISSIRIDGSGNVLGQSCVTEVRADSCLPWVQDRVR
ncbi:MAG: pre-peptidase C-terminal domain-containing protein [Planctomycetia bacterium]|nr:pre-peptidase C-terminal domain-containing protein [Planctomycetia bacterium]